MFRLIRRGWRYVIAALTGRLDQLADPKVQIEQAIEEAKKQHALLSQQAAAVFANRHQLELKLGRQMEEVEKLQGSARQALVLAEQARAAGDAAKADDYEGTAKAFATRLVAGERAMEDLKALHDSALAAAEQARGAVEQNAYLLQQRLAERSKLLSQLETAKMQEQMNEALSSVSELSVPGDVPTLAEVRDKIETRYAKALGQAEITSGSFEARMLEVEKAAIDDEGAQRLESIRASMTTRPSPERGAIEAEGSTT